MRNIAKEISKTNILEFLKVSKDTTYEEVIIEGLVISSIKDEKTFYKYHQEYINKIDNWSVCDTYCNSIKIVKKYEEKYFKEAINLSLKEEEFLARTGLIMIKNHFINKNNLHDIFNLLNKINNDKYYVNMAEAWLLCELFIKHKDETYKYLENHNLNKFTINKTISKIHDSYRVSEKDKESINKFKVKD